MHHDMGGETEDAAARCPAVRRERRSRVPREKPDCVGWEGPALIDTRNEDCPERADSQFAAVAGIRGGTCEWRGRAEMWPTARALLAEHVPVDGVCLRWATEECRIRDLAVAGLDAARGSKGGPSARWRARALTAIAGPEPVAMTRGHRHGGEGSPHLQPIQNTDRRSCRRPVMLRDRRARITTIDGSSRVQQNEAVKAEATAVVTGDVVAALRMGVAWYDRVVRRRTARAADRWQPTAAVRRDWPGSGHDFAALGLDGNAACRWIARDAAYWRHGPARPTYSLVTISARDFYLHWRRRLRCASPDCPLPAASVAAATGAVR